jgi:hypothetical protein
MSSSSYPTINYDVFIPSDWTSTSSGLTQAQADLLYLKFPIAQTTQAETLNNITLNGVITTSNQNPFVINSSSQNMSITSILTNYTGTNNTCWGYNALYLLGGGNYNSAFGSQALKGVRGSANDNTGIGYNAGTSITDGTGNTCIGSTSGSTNITTGVNNTFLGYNSSASGNYNNSTAIGSGAVITSSNQVVLGTSSETVVVPSGIIQTTRSNSNTLISSKASFANIGSFNTCLGSNALNSMNDTNATQNTCIGYGAGQSLGSALNTIPLSCYNTFLGSNAGLNVSTGYSNICIGLNAGVGATPLTTGSSNTLIGTSAITTLNSVVNSTAIGAGATITANNQVVLGTSSETVIVPSGFINTSANNIFFSSVKPTLGNYNIGIGIGTFQSGNSSTINSVGIGLNALQNAKSSSNTAVGMYSLPNITSGGQNTAIGFQAGGINAGSGLVVGTNNTFLGSNTNVSIGTISSISPAFNNSTAIGNNATITASNQIVMGTATESVVIPSREIIGLATPYTAGINTSFTITSINDGASSAGIYMITSASQNFTIGTTIFINSTATTPIVITGGVGTLWTINQSLLISTTTTGYYLAPYPTFTISSIPANSNTMTTTGNPPLAVGMVIGGGGGQTQISIIGSGSANTWGISNAQATAVGTTTANYISGTTSINIYSIVNGTMTLNTPQNIPMYAIVFGTGIPPNTYITASNTASEYILNTSTLNYGSTTGYYINNNNFCYINSMTSTTMNTINSPPLAIGMYVVGMSGSIYNCSAKITSRTDANNWGISGGTNITGGGLGGSSGYYGNIILPYTASFPLSESYYISPSFFTNTPVYINFTGIISSSNYGAKTCFRMINNNSGINIVNSAVSVISPTSNIFNSTSTSTPVSTHTIYTSGSTAILSHTFYVFPSVLSSTGYGWFQQGAV